MIYRRHRVIELVQAAVKLNSAPFLQRIKKANRAAVRNGPGSIDSSPKTFGLRVRASFTDCHPRFFYSLDYRIGGAAEITLESITRLVRPGRHYISGKN